MIHWRYLMQGFMQEPHPHNFPPPSPACPKPPSAFNRWYETLQGYAIYSYLIGASNLTVAARWNTTETFWAMSCLSSSLRPRSGSVISPAIGTNLSNTHGCSLRSLSNNYVRVCVCVCK